MNEIIEVHFPIQYTESNPNIQHWLKKPAIEKMKHSSMFAIQIWHCSAKPFKFSLADQTKRINNALGQSVYLLLFI